MFIFFYVHLFVLDFLLSTTESSVKREPTRTTQSTFNPENSSATNNATNLYNNQPTTTTSM